MDTPPEQVQAKRVPGTAIAGSPAPSPLHTHAPVASTRFILAFIVAIASDIVSLLTEIVPPLQLAVDGVTAFLLFLSLGRNLAHPSRDLIAEAIPGIAAFPSWIFVVLAIFATDRKRRRNGTPPGRV